MKRIIGYIVVCAPAILPDALSLATQFSYIGAAISGVLLLTALWHYRGAAEEDHPEQTEVIGVLALAFVASAGFSAYRLGSGSTATANFVPDFAESLAQIAGTQERLDSMLIATEARLGAVERIASLEAELNALERDKQRSERLAQERERDMQAEFRRAMEETRGKIEQEYSQAKNVIEIDLYPGMFDAGADMPGYISDRETTELNKWGKMTPKDLIFETEALSPTIWMGRPRNLTVHIKIGNASQDALWAFEDSIKAEDLQTDGSSVWSTTLSIGTVNFPAEQLSSGPYFFCLEIRDLDGGPSIAVSSVEIFEIETWEIETYQRILNNLPRYWNHSHTGDKHNHRVDLAQFCGFEDKD